MKKSFRLFSCLGFLSLTLTGCGSGGGSTEPPVEPPTHEHTWADPTYTWYDDYSSCTAERVCIQDSNHKESETANSTYIVVTEASCETDGLGRYTVSFENSAFLTQSHDTVIETFGHDWGTPTYTWADDYSSCTAERVCLNDSSHTESETVNSTYETITKADEYTDGLRRYTASFVNTIFETQTHDTVLKYNGEEPNLNNSGGKYKIYYGLYPQTNINDASLISELNKITTAEPNGWYLYEGEYYAKVSATPYSICKFDNGTTIESGITYWFKCEPIVWDVLAYIGDGAYYILSSVLLDAHYYNKSWNSRTIDGQTVYSNNYKYSDIRAWLNNEFYNSAFALENSYIQTTTVDNSASTTDSTNNGYACANTQDKVFLPSYEDYFYYPYGFSTYKGSSDTRYCRTTDWARARGAYYYSSSGTYQYNGIYWTRSPCSGNNYLTWIFKENGYPIYEDVRISRYSVRPALSIVIE